VPDLRNISQSPYDKIYRRIIVRQCQDIYDKIIQYHKSRTNDRLVITIISGQILGYFFCKSGARSLTALQHNVGYLMPHN